MDLIAQLEAEQIASLGKDHPDFKAGDTVRVGYKVTEGTRTRVQNYEGVCISRKNGEGIAGSFTVRKISFGEGVERVFPLTRPTSNRSTVVRRGRVRRAKLYYLRARRGKSPGSPRTHLQAQGRRSLRRRRDEKGHPSRLSHHRRQDDRRHRGADEIHLGRGRRHPVARHRPHGAPGLDRRLAPA
jgi:large subunit ribosomal protein L19